ncbi:MAG: hypothetical protein M5U34_17885 [Chloroflexi bacterium]|nr:hypothetical protein [Chloroflexota bacterium]
MCIPGDTNKTIAIGRFVAGLYQRLDGLFALPFGRGRSGCDRTQRGRRPGHSAFVFGISIAGEDAMNLPSLVPWAMAGGLALAAMGLVAWFTLPGAAPATAVSEPTFSVMLWEQRGLDVLVQIGLIFSGVLAILGILAERETAVERCHRRQTKSKHPSTAAPTVIIENAPDKHMQEVHA